MPTNSDIQVNEVYQAEEMWLEDCEWIAESDEDITPDTLDAFVDEVLRDRIIGRPAFALDVPDEHVWAAYHAGSDGVIHLHPRLLRKSLVLHELAHWIEPSALHGPVYASTMLDLVGWTFGEEARRCLADHYQDYDAEVA